jgi:hypothetical protein
MGRVCTRAHVRLITITDGDPGRIRHWPALRGCGPGATRATCEDACEGRPMTGAHGIQLTGRRSETDRRVGQRRPLRAEPRARRPWRGGCGQDGSGGVRRLPGHRLRGRPGGRRSSPRWSSPSPRSTSCAGRCSATSTGSQRQGRSATGRRPWWSASGCTGLWRTRRTATSTPNGTAGTWRMPARAGRGGRRGARALRGPRPGARWTGCGRSRTQLDRVALTP